MQNTGIMPQPAPQSGPEEGSGEEKPNVSPEEQAQYDKFVDNGMKVIYSANSFEAIKKRFKADPDHVGALAEIIFNVVVKLQGSAAEHGQPISPDVLLHGGTELLENVADAFKQAKIYDFSQDEIDKALYKAMDLYGEHESKAGKINPGAFQNEFASLIKADKSGQLEKEVPGLKEKFGSQGPGSPAAPVDAGGQPNG